MIINLAFHNIVEKSDEVKDENTIDVLEFLNIINSTKLIIKNSTLIKDFKLFFDDGYDCFYKIILSRISKSLLPKITLAITTDWIDRKGFLTSSQLKELSLKNINIASHSVSHPALALRQNNDKNLSKGKYHSVKTKFGKRLTINEVKFQMIESKIILEKLISKKVNDFILPYGTYNTDTIKLASSIYTNLYSLDLDLDDCTKFLRPRILVQQGINLKTLINKIL